MLYIAMYVIVHYVMNVLVLQIAMYRKVRKDLQYLPSSAVSLTWTHRLADRQTRDWRVALIRG